VRHLTLGSKPHHRDREAFGAVFMITACQPAECMVLERWKHLIPGSNPCRKEVCGAVCTKAAYVLLWRRSHVILGSKSYQCKACEAGCMWGNVYDGGMYDIVEAETLNAGVKTPTPGSLL